ncbi:MAG TPA: S8 family serine peptidase, partial [Candidatus Krumholzibacteria bacterium]|nr:S8 family serine peptidase [Candidatus Krumholzibacteria bacterium]
MKRTAWLVSLSIFVVLLLAGATVFANAPYHATPRSGPATAEGARYATDHVLVQFKAASLHATKFGLRPQATSGVISTGMASVDAISRNIGVIAISRPFVEPADAVQTQQLGIDRWYSMQLPGGSDIMGAIDQYMSDPNVESATPDYIAELAVVPTDPAYPQHWGHNNTAQLPGLDWGGTYDHTLSTTVGTPGFDSNAQAGWGGTAGFGSSSVIIAIVDTGCNLSHPDLAFVTGWDFGDNDSNPEDNSSGGGHGTCCAGVAAAKVNNGNGACGAAPGCLIMPMKAANSAGSLLFSSIVNCITWATDHGANVISMSFGAAITSDPSTDSAISYAISHGVTLLAATGNENKSTISYPAINANVIGVGAASPCGDRKRSSSAAADLNPGVSADPHSYTCDGERWWGSNYGTTTANAAGAVDIIAPTILYTTDILGAGGFRSGDYEPYFNGTSCATPYAAGVCALIKSKNPSFTPAQVKTQLENTAQDIVNVESGAGWDRYSGFGMVDINAAVGGGGCSPVVSANFTGTPTTGAAPLTVNFTDASTGSPTSWSWTFGDGGTSTAQNPSHVYSSSGTFTVALTATNACGGNTNTKTGYITVTGGTPTWTTITSDNFESGFGSYTDGGADCSRYTATTFSHQGAASLDIQDNTSTSIFT